MITRNFAWFHQSALCRHLVDMINIFLSVYQNFRSLEERRAPIIPLHIHLSSKNFDQRDFNDDR